MEVALLVSARNIGCASRSTAHAHVQVSLPVSRHRHDICSSVLFSPPCQWLDVGISLLPSLCVIEGGGDNKAVLRAVGITWEPEVECVIPVK